MAGSREESHILSNGENLYEMSPTRDASVKVLSSERAHQSLLKTRVESTTLTSLTSLTGTNEVLPQLLSPAPAVSHQPPDIDHDELDYDEYKRPRPRFSQPLTPRRTPHGLVSPARVPVVVEDDDDWSNGYDPDEHVSGCL